MTPARSFALLLCLLAARRRPLFATVAAVLGAESAAGYLAPLLPASCASCAWTFPAALASRAACVDALPQRWRASLPALAPLASAFWTCQAFQLLTSGATCAYGAASMVACTRTTDSARVALTMLLAGNVAASLIALVVGPDLAYASGAVAASNAVVHVVISGLAAWTMLAR